MARQTLDRTLLLMRDLIPEYVPDEALLAALLETSVALVANAENLKSHSAQSAYVTAAILLARSGHRVSIVAPNIALVGRQPPLGAGHLVDELDEIGRDIVPGVSFVVGEPKQTVDVAILFGNTPWRGA